MPIARVLAFALFSSAVACSKVTIRPNDGGGPTNGGAPSVGGAPSGGGGQGEGGAPIPSCILTRVPGDVALAGGESLQQEAPSLGAQGDDVALVHTVQPPDSNPVISVVQFSPWASWPPAVSMALPSEYMISSAQSADFGPLGVSALVSFAGILPQFLADVSQPGEAVELSNHTGEPAFLASNGGRWLGGYTSFFNSQLNIVDIGPDLEFSVNNNWGCGGLVRADAIAWEGESFLVATSSDTEFGGCSLGGETPATRLQIARFSPGLEAELMYEEELGARVRMLSLAPRSGGAWLSYRLDIDDVDTPIVVRRLGEDGAPIGAATEIVQEGYAGSPPFDAAPMGERLALSFRTSSPSIGLQLVEADGTLGATATMVAETSSPTSVLGSGDRLLLGWVESVNAVRQVRVSRFDCVEP